MVVAAVGLHFCVLLSGWIYFLQRIAGLHSFSVRIPGAFYYGGFFKRN